MSYTYRPPRKTEYVGACCSCLECQAAGVTDKPIVKVPADEFVTVAHWLHGEPLKRWYEARDEVRRKYAAVLERLGPSERPRRR